MGQEPPVYIRTDERRVTARSGRRSKLHDALEELNVPTGFDVDIVVSIEVDLL